MPKMEDEEEFISQRESDLRWENHDAYHESLEASISLAAEKNARALIVALADHHREHEVHERAHDREHTMTGDALNKADSALEKRLEGMNGFRSQLQSQANTFVNRDVFEQYTKEQATRAALATSTSSDKYDAILKEILSRHEIEMANVKEEIQQEREHRKTFEGSVNTWKWIASFLGASGVAGVILLFATRTG